MSEDNGKQWPKFRKNEYGTTEPPITSHVVEGPNGYENIIGVNEVPEGLYKMSGLPEEVPPGNVLGKGRKR